MENLCGRACSPHDCVSCEFLRIVCSGPRTTQIESYQEWLIFIKAVMARFGISNRMVADNTPLSKSTVDDIIAGRRKNVSRESCCYIENYVLGKNSLPCAVHIPDGAEVVYQDRPETLEALRVKDEALIEKDHLLAETKQKHESEMQDYKELVRHLYTQINRKDDYIDRLAKKAGL